MQEIFSLAEYGLIGVIIALILLVVFIINCLIKFIKHQGDSFKNTVDTYLKQSSITLSENTNTSKSLNKMVEELLKYLRYKNGNR